MAKYTSREFAEICHIEPKNINVYYHRGQIIRYKQKLNGQYVYDSADKVNAAFILNRKTKHINAKKKEAQKRQKRLATQNAGGKKEITTVVKIKNELDDRETIEGQEAFNKAILDSRDLKEELDKLKIEKEKKIIELKDIEIEQKRGLLVDSNEMSTIVKNWSIDFKTQLKENLFMLIEDFCLHNGISQTKQAKVKSKIIDVVNESSNTASENQKTMIDKIVSAYEEEEE